MRPARIRRRIRGNSAESSEQLSLPLNEQACIGTEEIVPTHLSEPLPPSTAGRIAETPARLIAALFRDKNVRPLLLLGAGASYSSGVPTADIAVDRIAREAFVRRVGGGLGNPSEADWRPWLTSQPWFVPGEENRAENFPLAVKHLLTPAAFRRDVLMKLTRTAGVGAGYEHLARLWKRGYFSTILSPNFDQCPLLALRAVESVAQVAEVNRSDGDFAQFDPNARYQFIWLHGNNENYTALATPEEVSQLNKGLVSRLRPLLDYSPLIVIGYRGAEASIMDHLLLDKNRSEMNYPKGLYWCVRRGEELHPRVAQLRAALGGNFHLLEIDGFDELMTALAEELGELPTKTWFEGALSRRVALASLLVKDLRSDPYFGRIKMAKMFYLLDVIFNLDLGTRYYRAAYGPLDRKALQDDKYGVEALAKRYNLFSTEKIDGKYRYRPLNLDTIERLVSEHLGDKVAEMRAIVRKLGPRTLDHTEIVATLYACWNDLLIRQRSSSDAAIIAEFLQWSPTKMRFLAEHQREPEKLLQNALSWMRDQRLIPKGRGGLTWQRSKVEIDAEHASGLAGTQ